ncbi:MAG TPA: L-lactate dehydrogenase [Ruminococcaceae bacterium]|nr:L-lactate dehydrogenase [Oscillospiraceae bacterium]HCM23224.1 L-lactate dehydrogenase [Oscillospiraceae bacterium]
MINLQRCAIIGCGSVGATSAFTLMESGLFNEMVLIDVNHEKAEGEAMDLSHGLAFTQPMEITAGSYEDVKDAGIIIITAGAGQKPGETRMDLVHKNVGIFKNIIPEIIKYNQNAILLVVANPVDILTWVTYKLSGYPAARVLGSGTVLDTARLKYLLGRHLGVDPRNIHAFIIGEHGDSELAVWSNANVNSVPLNEFCELCGYKEHRKNRQRLYEKVKNSAYRIIEKKGATYYGIALAVRRICECIVRDEHSILPVSSLIQGHFGLSDLCMSVPTIVGNKGVERILDINLNQDEQMELERSASELKKVLAEI